MIDSFIVGKELVAQQLKSCTTGDTASQGSETAPAQMIKIIEIINPMRPDLARTRLEPWLPGKPLIEYIPDDGNDYIASLSGGIVDVADWETRCPHEDDAIVICPVIAGGGSGKAILRIIALVLVMVFAAWAAPWLTATFGAVGGAMAGAAIMIGGAMLVNTLIPMPGIKNNSNSDLSESPSYGISGARNTSSEGTGVPVCYGRFRMGGNIVSMTTENVGRTQLLYMLLNAGEGPVAGISDILINDQPIEQFRDAAVEIRIGENNQTSIPWFNKTTRILDAGAPILMYGPVEGSLAVVKNTTSECDALRVDIIAQNGLYSVDEKRGTLKSLQVPITIARIQVDEDGEPLPGATWVSDFGSSAAVGFAATYNYLPGEVYNAETGVIIERHEGYTLAHLIPGHFVVSSHPVSVWMPGATYQTGQRVTIGGPSGLIFACTMGHIAAESGPTLGGPWIQLEGSPSSGSIIDPGSGVGMPVGYASQKTMDMVGVGATSVYGKSRFPLRFTFTTGTLPFGRYKIAVVRNTAPTAEETWADEVRLEAFGEITNEKFEHPNTALLGLRIRLSDQLSQVPNVTFINEGVMTRFLSSDGMWKLGSTGNPAWAALDMLTNESYGARIPWSMIDRESFIEWAKHCDSVSPPLRFDCVLDRQMAFWDAMKYVGRAGHAQITRVGTRFSVVIEREEDPIMMFSEANILKGTFSVDYLSMADRANTIDVSFFDQAQGYKQRTVKVVDPNLTDLAHERNSAITLFGVVDRARATQEAWLQLNLNNWTTRTVSFEAGLDAIACVPGSVITVKHVAMEAASSGRVVAVSGQSISLSSPIDMSSGAQFKALVHIPSFAAANWSTLSRPVDQIDPSRHAIRFANASAIDVGFGLGVESIRSLTRGVKSWRVTRWERRSATSMIAYIDESDSLDDIVVGHTFQAHVIDAVVELNASRSSGEPIDAAQRITLASTGVFVSALAADQTYVVGPNTEERRQYRVVSIEVGENDTQRKISAIEYHPEVYEAGEYLPPEDPNLTAGIISHVRGMEIKESEINAAFDPHYELELRWNRPVAGQYSGAEIFRKENGTDDWVSFAQVLDNVTTYHFEGAPGEQFRLKVVAIDATGARPPFSSAPELLWTVGSTLNGVNPTDLTASPGFRTIYLAWGVDRIGALRETQVYATFSPNMTDAPIEDIPDPSSDFSQARLIATTASLGISVAAAAGKYRFWIKCVDNFGTINEDPYPSGGLVSYALMTISDMMDWISDEIYASMLDRYLRERIEIIPRLVDLDQFQAMLGSILEMGLVSEGNGAAVRTLESAMEGQNENIASQITSLQAVTNSNSVGLIQEVSIRAEADRVEALQRTQLAARMEDVEGLLNGEDGVFTLIGGIDQSLRVTIADLMVVTESQRTMASFLTGSTDGSSIEAGSFLYDLDRSVVQVDEASATRVQQMEAWIRYGDPTNPSLPSLHSVGVGVTNISTAVVSLRDNEVRPLVQNVNQIWSEIDGMTTSIEQRVRIDELGAMWTVKVDANNRVAGIGLGYEVETDIFDFIVRTDRFAVGGTDGTAEYPFIIAPIPGDPQGRKAVFIDKAMIKEADIDTLRLANNAVSVMATGETSATLNGSAGMVVSLIYNAQISAVIKANRVGQVAVTINKNGQTLNWSNISLVNRAGEVDTIYGCISVTATDVFGGNYPTTYTANIGTVNSNASNVTANGMLQAIGLKR